MKKILFSIIATISLCAQSICIDPGHGGSDPGAVGWGLQEKNINLDVSQRLYNSMKQNGWTAYLVRSNDKTVSLSSRTSYANSLGVKRFVSIHCNAFNKSANGTETFSYTKGSSKSFSMRDRVHPRLVRAMGTRDRGTKTANFYVIKHTNMPAILCELAFIDEKNDSAKLGDSYYRGRAAAAIRDGLLASFAEIEQEIVSSSEYMAPKWSPDGKFLLVTQPGYNGLNLLNTIDLTLEKISSENSYNAKWISTQEILCGRNQEQKVVNTSGIAMTTMSHRDGCHAQVKDGIVMIDNHGTESTISVEGDIIFHAVISPDNKRVAYETLYGGIHISDINGENTIVVGTGNNPSWLPNSSGIVYDSAVDNGHELVQSDIFMFTLQGQKRTELTNNIAGIAQRPSVSPNGDKIAFDVEGDIFIATMSRGGLSEVMQITE